MAILRPASPGAIIGGHPIQPGRMKLHLVDDFKFFGSLVFVFVLGMGIVSVFMPGLPEGLGMAGQGRPLLYLGVGVGGIGMGGAALYAGFLLNKVWVEKTGKFCFWILGPARLLATRTNDAEAAAVLAGYYGEGTTIATRSGNLLWREGSERSACGEIIQARDNPGACADLVLERLDSRSCL